jgi:hypothetical protein
MTMNNDRPGGKATLARLQQVLDSAGAKPARWPAAERAGLERLVASDTKARRMVAEARALDRLLTLGQSREADVLDTTIDSIMARITDRQPAVAATPQVVAAPVVASGKVLPFPPRDKRPTGTVLNQSMLQAGALLAACLLVGVVVGPTGRIAPVLQDAAERLGISIDASEAAQGLLVDEWQDEDQL